MSNETEKEEHEYPNIVERFREVLKKLGIKKYEGYVDHCAKGDLEDLEDIEQKLYEMGLHPSLRNQVINFWAAEIKKPVPKKLQKRLTEERTAKRGEAEEEKEPEKYSVDTTTGVIKVASTTDKMALTWDEAEKLSKNIKAELADKAKKGERKVAYVYDPDTNTVRMAREDEIGGTLEQAKELKRMASEGKGKGEEESPFITDADGNWTLNPRARVTGVELMALESIKRSQERGEEVDPIEVLGRAVEKMKVYQEAFGGGARQSPDWMTDPLKFIETVERISGGGKGDEALKTELAELRKSLDDMREERHREQVEVQQRQIGALTDKVGELTDLVIDMKRPVTGRTEMDLLHEIADKGLEVIKTELPGFRKDIKDAVIGGALPLPKSAKEREEQTQRLRHGVKKDREIEAIGRRMFLGEGGETGEPAAPTSEPAPPQPSESKLAKEKTLMDEKFPFGTAPLQTIPEKPAPPIPFE